MKDGVEEDKEKDDTVLEMSSSLSSTGFETDEVRNVRMQGFIIIKFLYNLYLTVNIKL